MERIGVNEEFPYIQEEEEELGEVSEGKRNLLRERLKAVMQEVEGKELDVDQAEQSLQKRYIKQKKSAGILTLGDIANVIEEDQEEEDQEADVSGVNQEDEQFE
jgi:hypothetical protein